MPTGRAATEEAHPVLRSGRRTQYGFSEDTWTRATVELRSCGLLTVGQVRTGRDLDMRRTRNTYWLNLEVLSAERDPVAHDGGPAGEDADEES